jgi:hypothetical protein
MNAPLDAAKEWDKVRRSFADSIMVDTQLTSLAQNLDGLDWPIKGKDETPAKYIDLSRAEVIDLLALKGLSADKFDHLVSILRETLAFDSPFGEMAEASARDNALLRNMARLRIPEDFPISLTTMTPDTRKFCELEHITTLGAFAEFAQQMSQNVIVGGDFRKLLNALSHVDEAGLAEMLPLRPGGHGIHLVEALAQATLTPDPAAHAAAARAWFPEEDAILVHDAASPGLLARHFVVLGNAELEQKAAALVAAEAAPEPARAPAKGGFFSSLARLFKK